MKTIRRIWHNGVIYGKYRTIKYRKWPKREAEAYFNDG